MLTAKQISLLEKNRLNTGLIIQEPLESDYLGGQLPYEIVVEDGDWSQWLPTGEKQKFARVETMSCVSQATSNSIDCQITRMIKLGLIETEPLIHWLDANGNFNSSDRFIAKMSGTTVNGNSLNNPSEAVRKFGVPPESIWGASEDFTWNDYYRIPSKEAIDWGKRFLEYFDVAYEWVTKEYVWGKGIKGLQITQAELVEQLKQAPIIIGAATCAGWFNSDIIAACNLPANHGTMVYKSVIPEYFGDFDSYEPWEKKINYWYKIPFAIKMIVTPREIIKKKITNNPMAKLLKQENGKGYGLLLEAINPASLMGMAWAVGKTIPGELPDNVNWADLDAKLDGTYTLKNN